MTTVTIQNGAIVSIPEPATMIVWSLLGAASWLGMRVGGAAQAGRPAALVAREPPGHPRDHRPRHPLGGPERGQLMRLVPSETQFMETRIMNTYAKLGVAIGALIVGLVCFGVSQAAVVVVILTRSRPT